MNSFKRLSIQGILWFVVGAIIWLNQDATEDILLENLAIFTCQLILIIALVYFAAPTLLFEKKYVLFAVFSIALIAILVWILAMLFPVPIDNLPPIGGPDFGRPPIAGPDIGPPPPGMRKPPSHLIIHALMLVAAYALAIVTEVFIFLKAKDEETIKTKNVNLQNELKLLKSQINPHFLFNSLNNIYTLAGMDSNKTQKGIIHLSDMLRYVLYECDQETVPIKKEVEYIENYLKLFALRSSKDYPISTELNISDSSIPVSPMLFIPFVENALKHSNIDDIENSYINIKISADSKEIYFEVDNSIPQKPISKDDVGGIGLENVKKRLAILFPEKHRLEISESTKSFKVNLHLKLT